MIMFNAFLLIFAIAFMGCVLATPVVTRVATWAGAVDRPDQFRRIHKGATPRMGGLGLALGLALAVGVVIWGGYLEDMPGFAEWSTSLWAVGLSALIILVVGVVDDTVGVGPRSKMLGQATAVLVLYLGGVQITGVSLLGWSVDLAEIGSGLPLIGQLAPLSLLATMLWFLACMNIWNLIDGMDGLASGVGLLVSGTLLLVAVSQNNVGAAVLSAALAGGLAGFLLYNWHPACIFLGDTGSLLIGLFIGIIGVQGSMKSTTTGSVLFPILAMGLPISDTAMAIFRRWVRHLPLSSADRRHIHHLLIGLGLNPRQAAIMLYCFSGFLCGAVLLGVSLENEYLALVLGVSGILAFLLILTSRRDELKQLRDDFRARMSRGRQERFAAKATWEAIQRIELCNDLSKMWEIVEQTTRALGCDMLRLSCYRGGRSVFHRESDPSASIDPSAPVSGPTATFRLTGGQDLLLTVSLHQTENSTLAADIAFRFLQRLSLATAERMERLLDGPAAEAAGTVVTLPAELQPKPAASLADVEPPGLPVVPGPVLALNRPAAPMSMTWFRSLLRGDDAPVVRRASLSDE